MAVHLTTYEYPGSDGGIWYAVEIAGLDVVARDRYFESPQAREEMLARLSTAAEAVGLVVWRSRA